MKLCTKHPELEGRRYSNGQCAACAKEASAAWRKANPDKVRALKASWLERNREKSRLDCAAWHKANPERSHALSLAWRTANPERMKANSLKRSGFTPHMKEAALGMQGFRCAICLVDLREAPTNRVHADHCHTTGVARGVLCNRCNTGLGKFADSPDVLRRAIAYLENPTLSIF